MRLVFLLLLPSLALAEPVPWCVEEGPLLCCPAIPVTRLSATEYVIDKAWMRESNAFATETGCGTVLEPVPDWAPLLEFRRGGAMLEGLTEQSGFFRIGLRASDVVMAIQGVPFSAADHLLDIYANGPSISLLVVDVERDGRPLRFWYHLVEGCYAPR